MRLHHPFSEADRMKRLPAVTAIAVALSIASPLAANAQQNLKPVSPGPGWFLVSSWCVGPAPRTKYCPPGKYGQVWMWAKFLPRKGASKTRASYLLETTYPRWKPHNRPSSGYIVCETWDQYPFPEALTDSEWEPIRPGSLGETMAEKACSGAGG